nr:hypothetical protein [Cytophagales bacterium]
MTPKAKVAADIASSAMPIVQQQLDNLINHLASNTLNGLIGIANDTKFGLSFNNVHFWQATYALKPGIPMHITPHDKEAEDLVIPLENKGLDGVFAILGYDVCEVDSGDPDDYTKWKKDNLNTVIAIGMLVYSTAIGNTKFWVKKYKTSDWNASTWDKLFFDLDHNPSSNGTQPFNVDVGNGVTASCNSYKDVHGDGVRSMVLKIDLKD